MADRTVTVRLDADIKPYLAALAKAEAATKKFRDSFGKGMPDPFEPWDEETDKRRKRAPKDGEQIAGAFSRSFSRRLEAAFRSLPKAKIDGDSSDAQKRLQEVRASLQSLSAKQVGIDIYAGTALGEIKDLQGELERLALLGDIDVKADTAAALAQLRTIEQEVNKLNGVHPTVQPQVDAAQARAELDDLRRRLAELQERRRLGIDLDDGAAKSEINAIQRDLERLNASSADPKVRVDSAAALAQVRTIQSEMSRVDGRSARVKVDADVGGALRNIAVVAAALASLPSAVSIGVGVAGLGAAFGAAAAGAAGFAAVAVPGISRVTDALKQAESASGGAGGAVKSAAQKAAEAASSALRLAEAQDRIKDAAQGVKDAQRAVGDAMRDVRDRQDTLRQAQESAAIASARVAEVAESGARRIADAERTAQDAHRATQRALEDLTRARAAAQEKLEDLALATEGGALAEERAQLSLKRARENLARVTQPGSKATATDREDAELSVREAEFAVKRIKEANADLAAERADADRKGVEGSDEVLRAKEQIEAATRREADAERAVADARTQAARDVSAAQRDAAQAARDVARAQRDVQDALRDVGDAQRKVTEAERDALRAKQQLKLLQLEQKAAMEQTGGAAGGAASKVAELSAEEKKLAKAIKSFQDDYLAWQRSLQPNVFPVIEKGLDVLRVGMDRATPLVKGGAQGLDRFADASKKALQSKEWTSFFDDLGKKAPDAIAGLGDAAINVAGGLRGIIEGFLPYTGPITAWVTDVTQDFEDWGTSLKDSKEFKDFLAYAAEQGPKVADILGNIAKFVGKVVELGAGVGSNVLDFLVVLSDKLAGLDSGQIEAIAKGVGLIFAAVKIGATLKLGALVALAEVLSGMSPGQINALAVAIGLVVLAVKSYQGVQGAVSFFETLSGGIDKAGKSAGSATGKLSNLGGLFKGGVIAGSVTALAFAFDKVGDALDGLNPDIDALSKNLAQFGQGGKPAAELLDQLNPKLQSTIGRFENFGESAARLASDNPFESISESISGFIDDSFGLQLDGGRQAIDNLDTALSTMVANGNAEGAAQAFNRLATQAKDAGVPVDKLKELFPQYAQSMNGVPATTGEVGTAIGLLGGSADGAQKALGEATQKLSDWKSSLDEFNSQTDAAQAIREMEKAFKDTKSAIDAANGRLELTPGLTGKQRDAVIGARDAFAGYLEKVRLSSDAQATLSGRTIDARDSVLQQLPALIDLAGKNQSARDQVLKLAEAYGISREDAIKASKGGQDLVEVLAKIKSKDVRIGVDTHDAQEAIDGFIRLNSGRKIPIQVYAKQEKAAAAGAIMRYAQGGIARMAAGGTRPQPPHIVSKPTVLYGEGSSGHGATEAFIPYESQYRSRAIDLLSQVASDFGLEVYSARASDQVGALTGAIDATNMQVGTGLTAATGALENTLGQAGSLTSAITQVGVTAAQLDQGWLSGSQVIGDSINLLGAGVDGLSGSVYELTQTIGSLDGKGASSKSKAGSSKGGMIAGNQPAKKASKGGFVQGNQPVNSSRVSAPQQMPAFYSASTGQPGAETAKGAAGASSAGRSGSLITVQTMNVNSKSDADQTAAYLYARLGSKGPV
ncbi:hypothetical protein DMB42_11530 [Nonomuraea sp. WAC 01424]|uniref:hypothetical protein n=1 Tax=Nonomuraea sp. WAC 01424 TaxID=2203200 RepID=UPI000F79344B|nr:hypothetical protein [Nonomuraea sp. WAC 01424]RSN12802.1 hypothetical protein DMB42_11530 [Nonomuraea sp. WAC 01424]